MKLIKAYMKLGAQTGEEIHYVYARTESEGTDRELILEALNNPEFQEVLLPYFKIEG